MTDDEIEFGETWVYESIVAALPGIDLSRPVAIIIQLGLFEAGVVLSAWYYDLWSAVVAGTAAVLVAAIGSIEMLRISTLVRGQAIPETYRRLLFGSSVEVVLGVLAFVAVVTHLFVFDDFRLVTRLIGSHPPVVVVYLLLLILWDVCYRVGTGWWTSVTALWRSWQYYTQFDARTARALRRADVENVTFGVLQLLLLPFLPRQPVLAAALVAHVAAVAVVTGASILLLTRRITEIEDTISI
ncbi:DUF7530 family protein [Halocatena salina]|uniref:Uncharacterized protein n=1 Tax=Halocatena salina TaxID=2934340 RepID=A0A8T9ZYK6_9EURY|nr:hypothetical protein [Halocatena salina]UPM41734.1 hypothetical protein MW046_06965 [Halocatena salina]